MLWVSYIYFSLIFIRRVLLKIFLSSFTITSNIIIMEDKSTLAAWHDRESLSSICDISGD